MFFKQLTPFPTFHSILPDWILLYVNDLGKKKTNLKPRKLKQLTTGRKRRKRMKTENWEKYSLNVCHFGQ